MIRLLALLLVLVPAVQETPADPGRFDAVATILEASCISCHIGGRKKAGLDLSTREGLLRGGESGPVFVSGKFRESLLYKVVARLQEPHMPQKAAKLPDEAVRRLAEWIDAGAPYARPLVRRGPEEVHWAFRPLRRSEEKTSIDDFIAAAQKARSLAFNPPADRPTIIRRVTFDLLGLPPAPEEIDAFVNDASPGAYGKLVERLLASPHFGERWARHWLDVARYADSEGYRFDNDRRNAWPYRDFVIRAFNDDLPYDKFVSWQLAGDELAPDNPQAAAATGFCTAGPVQEKQPADSKRNQERNRYDELDDIVATMGSAMLGLTLGCARCHDHKFDPVPTRDYYGLVAAFIGTKRTETYLADGPTVATYRAKETEFEKRLGPVQAALKDFLDRERAPFFRKKVEALKIREEDRELLQLPPDKSNQRQRELLTIHQKALQVADKELRDGLGVEKRAEWDRLAAEVKELEKGRPAAPPLALTLTEDGPQPLKNWLLERGQVESRKELGLGFLSVLPPREISVRRPAGAKTTFQRAALAEWITKVDGGAGALLARVIVNRLWHHHFGEGIVATPNDFGAQGEPPSHPELLDWLANQLVARGWRLKEIHRLILMSATYRQSADWDEARAKIDPDNRLLWRRKSRRLEAEAIRDAILAASGRLNREMYGPGVKLPIPPELIITRTEGEHHYPREVPDGPPVWRRSIYAFLKRSVPNPLTEVFDAPSPSGSCGRRLCSTVAPQALLFLNDPFVRTRARDFAARLSGEADRIDRAFRIALGRPPRTEERVSASSFLERYADGKRGLTDLCQVLFTLNEFIYVD